MWSVRCLKMVGRTMACPRQSWEYRCAAVAASQGVRHCERCDVPPVPRLDSKEVRDDAEVVPDTNQAHILGIENHTSADCGEDSVGVVDVAGIAEALAALAGVDHHTALAWAEAASPNLDDSCTMAAAEASVRNPLLVRLT